MRLKCGHWTVTDNWFDDSGQLVASYPSSPLKQESIAYPDDYQHPYSLARAWDRHLISIGLLPIYTSDLSKVGPILVNPVGSKEYLEYGYDDRGYLFSYCAIVQAPTVPEATLPKEGRSSEFI